MQATEKPKVSQRALESDHQSSSRGVEVEIKGMNSFPSAKSRLLTPGQSLQPPGPARPQSPQPLTNIQPPSLNCHRQEDSGRLREREERKTAAATTATVTPQRPYFGNLRFALPMEEEATVRFPFQDAIR
nr:hypothetical protein Iba_chr02eCG0600 [Ipomoea batatas]